MSARKKITKKDRKYNFEIYGFDFMVDVTGQVYMLEINTNPCLEEPC